MFQNNLLMAAASISTGLTVDNSVRYNDDDSPRLIRTPGVAGNRMTGSISLWYKRGNLGSIMQLFNAGAGDDITFNASDKLTFTDSSGVSYITTQVFRDTTAWGHLLFAWDTTLATAGDRLRIYHNGVEITAFDTETNPSQFDNLEISNTVRQTIGANESDTEEFDGYLSQVYLVDGTQLLPASFGETDNYGIWRPIEYSPASDGTALTVSFEDTDFNNGSATSYTFSSQDLGTAAADRAIVITAGHTRGVATTTYITALTIGGVSATKITAVDITTGGYAQEMWWADVPSGTTGDVVVTVNSTTIYMAISVTALYGDNILYAVGTDKTSHNTDDVTVTIGVPAGGVAIASAKSLSASNTWTWTGVTEEYDFIADGAYGISGGSKTYSSAEEVTISAAKSTSCGAGEIVAIFAPVQGYGTNGFFLDFADSGEFGLYGTGANVLTDHPSAEADYIGDVSDFTFSGDDIVGANDKEIHLPGFFTGDCEFEFTIASGSDYGAMGFFDATEVGTIASSGGVAGMNSMTNSWYFEPDATLSMDVVYGGSDQAGYTFTEPSTQKMTRVGAVFKVYLDDVLKHTYTQEFSGPVGLAIGGHSSQNWDDIKWSADNYDQFISSGLAANDQVSDTPTTNWCTWQTLFKTGGTWNYVNGNLDAVYTSSTDCGIFANIGVSTGKWYWEFTSNNNYMSMGIVSETAVNSQDLNEVDPESGGWDSIGGDAWTYGYPGKKANPTTTSAYGATFTTEVIGIALDLDNDIIWFSKSGTYQNSATIAEVQDGDDSNAAFSGEINGQTVFPFGYAQTNLTISANFGQSAFAGTLPTGFKALNTSNLPAPQRIDDVDSQFVGAYDTGANIVTTLNAARNETWTDYINMYRMLSTGGTGANWQFSDDTSNQLTLPGPSPGAKSSFINPSVTGASATWNGYTWRVGAEYGVYTAEISHTNGSDTDQAHGLTSDSSRFMAHSKRSDAADEWWIVHPDLTSGNNINFYWAAETATEYVTVDGTNVTVKSTNATGTYRVIVWAEMSGWRKFGKFTGNTNVDGPFLWVGGTPKFYVGKRSTAGEDYQSNLRARDPHGNPMLYKVGLDWTYVENTTMSIDGTAGGVKIRNLTAQANGTAMIFWSECTPFGGDGVSPATAV